MPQRAQRALPSKCLHDSRHFDCAQPLIQLADKRGMAPSGEHGLPDHRCHRLQRVQGRDRFSLRTVQHPFEFQIDMAAAG